MGHTSRASLREVIMTFGKLGLTSFGGPIAHLGYFRTEFVVRKRWFSESDFAELVAVCQSLPGPTSSQVGFAVGLTQAGYAGALCAWAAFTLPSAVALVALALSMTSLNAATIAIATHGLKLVAVAVVAQAVWSMARTFCSDWPRKGIAAASAILILATAASWAQLATIILGSVIGAAWLNSRGEQGLTDVHFPISRRGGSIALLLFAALLLFLPIASRASGSQILAEVDAFYRAGALVFGGGHVVLPLLQHEVVNTGWLAQDRFLAGYGLVQAMPGPLFTFAAYLGALLHAAPFGLLVAAICLVSVFAPGMLLLIGVLPFWNSFRRHPMARNAIEGTSAAVVGVLLAALYEPVLKSAVHSVGDASICLGAFALLVRWHARPILVVAAVVLATTVATWL